MFEATPLFSSTVLA